MRKTISFAAVSDIDKDNPDEDIDSSNADENSIRQPGTAPKDDHGTELARAADGGLAADAATYLARSGYSVASLGESTEEIERQAADLVQWARKRNVLLTDAYFSGLLKHESTTAEHEVFFRASDNRVLKRTYPGTFGVTPEPKGRRQHATPLFYLHRLELMNRVFGSELQMEGVNMGRSLLIGAQGFNASIVVSQPWIRAADPANPHPSAMEVAQFMQSLGFVQLKPSYFGWHREIDGCTVLDARPDNFIKSAAGVVPIDLVLSQRALGEPCS